jgi:hypothetical protein
MTLVAYTYDIQPGSPEDITQVMANFNTLKAVVNGQLDDANLAAAAGISPAKLAGYPNDSSKTLRGDGSWLAAGGVADGYGTTLPGSPSSGDRFILVDSTTNPTYEWYFRYNSGSASAFKWECIGGTPALITVAVDESTASTTYTALGTAGPSFTVPRAGDYLIRHGFSRGATGNAAIHGRMSFDVGASAAADADSCVCSGESANSRASVTQVTRKNGLAASAAIIAKYRASAAAAIGFDRRWLEVKPYRVS